MLFRSASRNHNSGAPRAPAAPKAVINYINRGPSNEKYDFKRKRQKLLRAALVRERVNSIRPRITGKGPCPIDGTIIFPPVDPTRILQQHCDALILSLEMGDSQRTTSPSWPSHSQRTIFGGTRFITLQCHLGAHMAALHESHPLYVSSNGKFSYRGWANRPIRQPVSRSPMLSNSTKSKD